ncbi:hypothetical protein CASFOL_012650 [Castilleja foliolosa]|uniref:TMEM205-like domain-containing protein n=1 Tax=Castilleja foliolosa TaxID=1961234 RepID=A0ABD3DHN5_9LAMI
MMKVLVLSLIVFTSFANAGFFTPSPEKPNSKDEVVIKISPKDTHHEINDNIPNKHDIVDEKGYVTNAKEKLTQAKEKMKESTSSLLPDQKSTDTIDDVSSKAKETVAGMKEGAKQQAGDVSSKAKEKVAGMKEGVKQQASDVSTKAKETVAGMKEGAKQQAVDAAKRAKEDAKKGGQKGVKLLFKQIGFTSLSSLANVLHLLGFAVAYGTSVWVTFASSYVMAGSLPRSQFAMVQSKIFPVYFKAMAGSVGLALLGHLMSRVPKGMFGLDLAASLAMILVNLLYLEPRTTKVMFERMKKEKEEGHVVTEPEEASKEKKEETTAAAAVEAKPRIVRTREILKRRLNSNSSLLNIVTLVPLTWHLVHLAQNLNAVCQA